MQFETLIRVRVPRMERGLARRTAERTVYPGMDEKSIGSAHQFASLLTSLENKRVWNVVAERDGTAAGKLLESFESRATQTSRSDSGEHVACLP